MLSTELFVQRTDCCRCLSKQDAFGNRTPSTSRAMSTVKEVGSNCLRPSRWITGIAERIFVSKARSPAMKLTGHLHKSGRLLHREEQAPASLSDESLSAPLDHPVILSAG